MTHKEIVQELRNIRLDYLKFYGLHNPSEIVQKLLALKTNEIIESAIALIEEKEADEAEIENDLSDGRESEKKEDGKIFLNGLEVKYPEQMIYKKPKWPKIEKMPDTTIPNREFMKINEILDRLELFEKELK